MANQNSPILLYEKHGYKHSLKRVTDSSIFILLLLLVGYRVISLLNNFNFLWFIALLCESWFTMSWIFTFTSCWTPAQVITYPEHLLHRVEELPAVDLFVTTADDVVEPPIMTVNTVLSLLALDYPSNKLACYVSDDACSPLTFYALQQASHFAKFWVPFCNKYKVQVRAPFRYFTTHADQSESCEAELQPSSTPEFKQDWLKMKEMYEKLSERIEEAGRRRTSIPSQLDGEFGVFSNTERGNHPPIIKVIWENKENLSEGLPHLIYISREKRPKHPHHFKAGAMNVLTRVSGLITNAPFTLNVDCDMFVNNPKIVLHAMCILVDPKGEKEVAFVQCPQKFYGGLKDDPLGNQLTILFKYLAGGLAGMQGPFYGGTNCFHRRKVIYGLSPDDAEKGKDLTEKELKRKFGGSEELVKAAGDALEGKTYSPKDINISNSLKAAFQVAACGYEYGTGWGDQMGWIYGSITEDIQTGLSIHRRGWRSEMCTPNPFAFTGCAPVGLPASLKQQKRWATGMLEIFFTKHSPILATLFGKLQFRQLLAYMWIMNWGLQPLSEIAYVCLITYCIITNSYLFPQGSALWIPITLVIVQMASSLSEYLVSGMSIRTWWNNQRMSRIYVLNARFCGIFTIILKFMKISNPIFDITRKDQNNGSDGNNNNNNGSDNDDARFTFDESPVFVPGTTILILQLTAMALKLLELINGGSSGKIGLGEMFCSTYLVICHWPFLKGLFQRGKYGIPLSTIVKSASLAFLFLQFCRKRVIEG